MTAADSLARFAQTIDARDWDGLRGLLADDFTAHYVHTGETFDRAGWVTYNTDYPGHWRFRWEDVVAAGERAVGRARVSNDEEVYHVACFLTLDDSGLIRELVEVWTDGQPSGP